VALVTAVGIVDVVDALRERLAQVVTGYRWDDSLAQPFEWQPDTFYAWAETTQDTPIGTGEVRQDFSIMLVCGVPHGGEEAQLLRNRETSIRLDRARADIMEWIREHANVPPWDGGNIAARSDEDFLRQLEIRGVAVMVGGYRLVE
jgi:hypothetical protein